MGKLTIPENVKLTVVERAALEEFQRSNKHFMSPDTSANYFALFREGFSLNDMLKTSSSWGLGALVDARIRYQWDAKLEQYIEDSHRQAYGRLNKFKADAINYIMDQLTLVHSISREEVIKYLANPTEANRPKKGRMTAHEYNEMLASIERILKLGEKPVGPPPATQPGVAVIAGPGSTVIAGGSGEIGSALTKMAEDSRRAKLQKG